MKHVLFKPKNMWKSPRQLVEKPESFGSFAGARVFSVDLNPLWVAKEMLAIILTVGPASYPKHGPGLRHFLLNKDSRFLPPFKLFSLLVPDRPEAGTILIYHAKMDTCAPAFKFAGAEISWSPFAFVHASIIGKGYDLNTLADIRTWCAEKRKNKDSRVTLSLHPRITGVDSIQSLLSQHRTKPQIDLLSEAKSCAVD